MASDAFIQGDTATGTLYEGMVAALGSQEALVVIEPNDYQCSWRELGDRGRSDCH